MDFTIKIYKMFLKAFLRGNYNHMSFYQIQKTIAQTFSDDKLTILRHDVDRLPINALKIAQIEKENGIKGTYYFRIVPESYDIEIMKRIAELGHEIGYHYEDVDLTIKNEKLKIKNERDKEKLIDLAYESFCKNLEMLKKNFDIDTICMHGSPLSKFDNKIIWEKYDYRKLGIIGEPYFDIDWDIFAYLTDTGRRWNGGKVSVRDKVNSEFKFDFKSTNDIIANIDKLPNKIMITVHPERWNNNFVPWVKQLIVQNMKNIIKKMILLSNQEA